MASADDERLDSGRIAALYLEYSVELRAFLLGVLKDRELAAEALQSAFTRAIEAGHTANEATIKGWLFRVAFNEAMAIRRRQNVDKRALSKLAWNDDRNVEGQVEHACRVETVQKVRQAIDKLPDDQRTVVFKRIYDEMKFIEIAEELGVPIGTVLTRMRLAMTKLTGLLKDENPDE